MDLKVGDLVETCALIPGFIVWINPKDSDDIEVQAFDKLNDYISGHGACHSVKNCGVHKISQFRAMCLCALGEDMLYNLFNDPDFDYNDDNLLYQKVLELRNENK